MNDERAAGDQILAALRGDDSVDAEAGARMIGRTLSLVRQYLTGGKSK